MKGITQQGDFGAGPQLGSLLTDALNAVGLTTTQQAAAQATTVAADKNKQMMEYALIGIGLLGAVYVTSRAMSGKKILG